MALATQCPHCQTTFRVAQDQLKLRAGLVRCGHCKEIFNGIEHLLPPTEAAHPAAPMPARPVASAVIADASIQQAVEYLPATAAAAPSAPVSQSADDPTATGPADAPRKEPPQVTSADFDIPTFESEESDVDETSSPAEPAPHEDPLQRMTLMDFTQELPDSIEPSKEQLGGRELSNAEENGAVFDAGQRDELDQAIEDLQRKPWRRKKKTTKVARVAQIDPLDDVDAEEDEPGFLKRGRRDQRFGRKLRILFGLGSVLLLITALAQGAYLFRNQIAGAFPQTKPLLTQMCDAVGCHIDLPAQIASVSIESSELQTLASAKDRFVLTTLLRNYSNTAQEWPYIELTLNDGNEKPLLRRVFKPADYVSGPADMRTGFAADSERTVKLSFELSQVQASGYRVYLFYP
ncbi:MAG TPA: DUF3426 domain-containing protein [Herminiimonas sp.]|nr:DUF3426 domain-containing protein [Herminiimonas sp.]